jgi:hypothetical protein
MKILTVSCEGMYRYYVPYKSVDIKLKSTCTKEYDKETDDDFDDFIVTGIVNNPPNSFDYYLSGLKRQLLLRGLFKNSKCCLVCSFHQSSSQLHFNHLSHTVLSMQ